MLSEEKQSKPGFVIILVFLLSMATGLVSWTGPVNKRDPGQSATTIKVMTYNIRYNNPGDSMNAWPNRADSLAGMIRKYNPDLIGFQEVLKGQLDDLLRLLPEYQYFGVGREDGREAGEFEPVFYRKTRFERSDGGNFWLSEHPLISGSKGWDAATVRLASWVKLKDKVTGRTLYHFNTHFDYLGVIAREESAKLLRHRIDSIAGKEAAIATGDFNCPIKSKPMKLLLKGDFLKDSRKLSILAPNGPRFTFSGFRVGGRHEEIIDHILLKSIRNVLSYRIIDDSFGGFYPSDHLPVMTEFLIH